ncbi:ankyrin repeat domain-containing protein [Wolbachia endosymbiont of Mansonella ozzardi]|uniref:ankyrin repeat domain-containing protein n=1 Tax=Wolbachia endosymbiont of Mansonella ozzardi TaxID=137464 RepID=UPI0034CFFACD|nr:ankyrin repeat domain-containing protein [Wolbachia endosymbiont of Mansonella ozzardi]
MNFSLHVTCMFCNVGFNVETIKFLLKSRRDINKRDNGGNTPLHQLVDHLLGCLKVHQLI